MKPNWMRQILYVFCALFVALLVCPAEAAAPSDSEIGFCTSALTANENVNSKGATVEETTLAVFAAQAFGEYAQTDIAIVCGGTLYHNMKAGKIYSEDIYNIFQDNSQVVVVEMTPKLLWDVLEYGVGFTTIGEDERIDVVHSCFAGFPQPAGFSYRYDCSQLPGRRMKSIVLDDGTELEREDDQTLLSVALTEDMICGSLGYEILKDIPIMRMVGGEADLMIAYVKELGEIIPPQTNRIDVIGTADNSIVNNLSYYGINILHIMPYVILLILLFVLPHQRHRVRNLDGSVSKRYYDFEVTDGK